MAVYFSYQRELSDTRWYSIRKGAIFGLFTGWLMFISYSIYSVGFIFGSILLRKTNEDHQLSISDLIVVRKILCIRNESML